MKTTLNLLFNNFNKAFDSVNFSALWKTLLRQSIAIQYINCERIIIFSRWNKSSTKKEIKQGLLLPLNLFNSILRGHFRKLV